MLKTVAVAGLDAGELRWIRTLVSLLRHPDPSIPELARQALIYLADAAAERGVAQSKVLNHRK
jgi:hypothetical protein